MEALTTDQPWRPATSANWSANVVLPAADRPSMPTRSGRSAGRSPKRSSTISAMSSPSVTATMVRHLGSGKTNWFLRHARSATGIPVSAFRQICSFSASEPKRRRRRYPSVARLEKRKYCLLRDGNSDAVERVDVEVSTLSLVGQAAELGAVSV